MARQSTRRRNGGEKTPGNLSVDAGGTGVVATLNLSDIQSQMTAQREAAQNHLTSLQNIRRDLTAQLEQVDGLIEQAGGEVQTATRRRGRPAGRSSGKRDPLGLRGYIARALINNKGDMKATDLTTQVLKDGWKNSSKTFPTQVYQIAGKMATEGTISNPSRGTYRATAKTSKFYDRLEADIKAAGA